MKHLFRIASLMVPSWLAWYVACAVVKKGELAGVISFLMGPLWILVCGAMLVRAIVVILGRRGEGPTPSLASMDILTTSGAFLGWTSSLTIVAALGLGYASLAVVGLLGTAIFHAAVIYALFALRQRDPIRLGVISRSFSPETLTEGEDVVEKIAIAGARVPLGFRLFISGRVGQRWAMSRHVLEATESGADVVLESQVGPAVRGEHEAEPLVVWLQDMFGLCRTQRFEIARTKVTVVPKMRKVDKSGALLERGNGPRIAKRTRRLPTEGAFELKEYQQGDDVRRIHWVRSLAAGQLIVRLPDEVPPDRPRVRLVLDTFFPEVFAMTSDTPSEVLDSLVGVWLAVARSLSEQGVRVTLAAAVPTDEGVKIVTQEMVSRAPHIVQRFGARIEWQNQMPVEAVLTDEATFVISRTVLAPPPPDPKFKWIIVTPPVPAELAWPFPSSARLVHPMGASDNRWSLRRRAVERFTRARGDHARTMLAIGTKTIPAPPGSFTAGTSTDGSIHLEAIR